MATDMILDNSVLVLRADGPGEHVVCRSTDLELDGGEERRKPYVDSDFRRALVHGANDQLIINYSGDYKGGTRVHGPMATAGLAVEGTAHIHQGLVVSGPAVLLLGAPQVFANMFSGEPEKLDAIVLLQEIKLLRAALALAHTRLNTLEGL